MNNAQPPYSNHPIAIWLFTCCIFIFLMVAIGGITRLTQSGLSITQWKPISGIFPPFSTNAWQEEFSHYQQSPEYLKKNIGMNLEDFKGIFWLEFIHRLVGRLTGFVFFIPFLFFLIKRHISKPLALKLGGIFALGGFQGVVGWYMVKSGLQDAPHVSQYWLAFHLGMAFLIYGLVFWSGLSVNRKNSYGLTTNYSLLILSIVLTTAVFTQIILGAFVAGTHAGLIYNTFPDMNGEYLPGGLFVMSPWYRNFFENVTTIQFNHRVLAYIVTSIVLIFYYFSCKFSLTTTVKCAIRLLPVIVLAQVCLGVLTLLNQVPVLLASLHQVFAVVLFTTVLFITHELRRAQG